MGKKDEVILSSCPIYSPHMEVSVFASLRVQPIFQVPLDPNLEISTFSLTSAGFDKTGSCQISQRNVSPPCALSAQEAEHDTWSQGQEKSLARQTLEA